MIAFLPHHCGSLVVLLKYTCVTFLQKKFYPQFLKPLHSNALALYHLKEITIVLLRPFLAYFGSKYSRKAASITVLR